MPSASKTTYSSGWKINLTSCLVDPAFELLVNVTTLPMVWSHSSKFTFSNNEGGEVGRGHQIYNDGGRGACPVDLLGIHAYVSWSLLL